MKFPANVTLHSQLHSTSRPNQILQKLTVANFSEHYRCYNTIGKGDILEYPSVKELKEHLIYRINNTVLYMYCYKGACYELHRNTISSEFSYEFSGAGIHVFINEISDGEMPIYEIIEIYKL